MGASEATHNIATGPHGPVSPQHEMHVRPLTRWNDQPEVRRAVWQAAVETAPEGKMTGLRDS